jgi:hypothetical protein
MNIAEISHEYELRMCYQYRYLLNDMEIAFYMKFVDVTKEVRT